MDTLAKRTTLFALVVSLLVSVCVFALPQQEAHAAGTPTATQQQVNGEVVDALQQLTRLAVQIGRAHV